MNQVKIFRCTCEKSLPRTGGIDGLEAKVNAWLAENPHIHVEHMCQSEGLTVGRTHTNGYDTKWYEDRVGLTLTVLYHRWDDVEKINHK